jgi:hypothetical protein
VIAAFDRHFNQFLVPLVARIKNQRPNIEIIVTINRPRKGDFNGVYRSNIPNYLPKFSIPSQDVKSQGINLCNMRCAKSFDLNLKKTFCISPTLDPLNGDGFARQGGNCS